MDAWPIRQVLADITAISGVRNASEMIVTARTKTTRRIVLPNRPGVGLRTWRSRADNRGRSRGRSGRAACSRCRHVPKLPGTNTAGHSAPALATQPEPREAAGTWPDCPRLCSLEKGKSRVAHRNLSLGRTREQAATATRVQTLFDAWMSADQLTRPRQASSPKRAYNTSPRNLLGSSLPTCAILPPNLGQARRFRLT